MSEIKEIQRSCDILGFGGVAKPVYHIFSTRYPKKEFLLVDKRKNDDKELEIFGNKKVKRMKIDIKPENRFDTKLNIIKEQDVVCVFLVVMKF